mgnify:CR=1 FL=1
MISQTLTFQPDTLMTMCAVCVSDNSGGTTTVVDVSGLDADTLGNSCATVTLNKIWFSVSMTAKVDAVKLMWDADTDACFLTVEQTGFLDYSSIGGIKNNKATNYTGDVKIVMPALQLSSKNNRVVDIRPMSDQ